MFDDVGGLLLGGILDGLADYPASIICKHDPIVSVLAGAELEVAALGKLLGHNAELVADLIREDSHGDRSVACRGSCQR